jgi:hypothetical protein
LNTVNANLIALVEKLNSHKSKIREVLSLEDDEEIPEQ